MGTCHSRTCSTSLLLRVQGGKVPNLRQGSEAFQAKGGLACLPHTGLYTLQRVEYNP
jgi:hypothetical protein